MENRITTLFGIRYPIIAGGMIWCSGWRLAAAVSDAGGLGLIGAGSMTPDLLREHIRKCRAATGKPFGVNVPLMYRYAEQIMQVVMEERVPAVLPRREARRHGPGNCMPQAARSRTWCRARNSP